MVCNCSLHVAYWYFSVAIGNLCPTGVLEGTEGDGRGEGSLKNLRPQFNRGTSLEEQMLTQAGYGIFGQFLFASCTSRMFLFVCQHTEAIVVEVCLYTPLLEAG